MGLKSPIISLQSTENEKMLFESMIQSAKIKEGTLIIFEGEKPVFLIDYNWDGEVAEILAKEDKILDFLSTIGLTLSELHDFGIMQEYLWSDMQTKWTYIFLSA